MTALPLSSIRTDGGTQPRSTMFMDKAQEYADFIADGIVLPPVTVFYDGTDYWLADGFHRRAAAEILGLAEIESDVRQGTRRDAILFSVGANAEYGLARTPEDKRRAVTTMLNNDIVAINLDTGHPWSDREIAKICKVSNTFVSALRPKVTVNVDSERAFRSKHGTVSVMNTSRIGSNPPPRPAPRPAFTCQDCGDHFSQEVWHCPTRGCDHHWPMTRDYCANCHEGEPPAPPPAAPQKPAVKPRDASGDFIFHALTEVVRQMKDLPRPADALSRFPIDLAHALPVDAVERLAQWLSEFAPLWRADLPRRAAWAQRLIHGKEKQHVDAE